MFPSIGHELHVGRQISPDKGALRARWPDLESSDAVSLRLLFWSASIQWQLCLLKYLKTHTTQALHFLRLSLNCIGFCTTSLKYSSQLDQNDSSVHTFSSLSLPRVHLCTGSVCYALFMSKAVCNTLFMSKAVCNWLLSSVL